MKKFAFLLCIIASMGFTVARENKAGAIAHEPAPKKIEHAWGYIESTSPQSYTITLQ